jgi:ribosome-binding factor A
MPREFSRSDRVADAIQRELATLIQLEMRDPRIGMVNVNSVDVSRDLAYAKVYVTFVDRPEQSVVDTRLKILNKASGYLRNLLGKSIQLRVVPGLQFQFDVSVDRGLHLSELIDKAVREDANHHSDDEDQTGLTDSGEAGDL